MKFEYKRHGWKYVDGEYVPNMLIKVTEEEIELFKNSNNNLHHIKNIRSSAINKIRKVKEYFKIDYATYLQLTKKCAICGFPELVILHHIIHKEDGGKDEIDNYIGLCRNCHDLHHLKRWSLDEIRMWYKTHIF